MTHRVVDFELPSGDEEGMHTTPERGLHHNNGSQRSMNSAPPAPPDQHRRTSLVVTHALPEISLADFGTICKGTAYRQIRRGRKQSILSRRGWGNYDPSSRNIRVGSTFTDSSATEETGLINKSLSVDSDVIPEEEGTAWEGLVEMFTENKINYLFVFIPVAVWSHANRWSDGSIFILNFLAMVPLASMLGVFTEELAAHTNDVIGGLINATFGNAVELVVAIQALLAGDYRVVQASLIGSVFSNLLLVLGMCFLFGGMKYAEQEFIAQGAVASISLLAFSGVALLLPEFFGGEGDDSKDDTATISRLAALLLIIMYGLLLWFQLKTHVNLFQGDDDTLALIPFSWALTGLVVITAIVTILSEFLVGSIDGFCTEFNLGRSFVGLIILPVVGNAVEHISAVSVAMKDKMDLALGVALGSSVQIALFVLPLTVVIGWFTGREMTMKFPQFEVALYLMSVIIVSMCLSNARSNWLEGSLLVSLYALIAVGIYFEKDLE
ncbi:calcium:proton antiporter [Skeletonema marinoi]|uniref:Calcium:proton antiporter n=1 Tax=Skeletonema marinoi TaxID=267567 RepID=A0AAD8Y9C4_9STRA|nr:calcium:proton antiporter [Skeletonema marinoi]